MRHITSGMRHVTKALVLAAALTASAFGAGCAADHGDDVASNDSNATAAPLATGYEGTIGNLKVAVRLDAEGGSIAGSYFYSDKVGNGDALVLKGTLAGSKLTLTESVNGAGATTGQFDGQVSDTGITGTWKAGNTTLPLTLTAIRSFKTITQKIKAAAKSDGAQYSRDCSLEAELVQVYGLNNAAAEKAIMDALKVDPLDKDAAGHCDSDIRYVTQSIAYNANGFLTVTVGTEYDGGAHPEIQSDAFNFELATGKNWTGKQIFKPGSEPALKAFIEKDINADKDLTADDKKESIAQFEQFWDEGVDLDSVAISLGEKGITINMGNDYPHVVLALAPVVEIPWSDAQPLLAPGPLTAIAK